MNLVRTSPYLVWLFYFLYVTRCCCCCFLFNLFFFAMIGVSVLFELVFLILFLSVTGKRRCRLGDLHANCLHFGFTHFFFELLFGEFYANNYWEVFAARTKMKLAFHQLFMIRYIMEHIRTFHICSTINLRKHEKMDKSLPNNEKRSTSLYYQELSNQ